MPYLTRLPRVGLSLLRAREIADRLRDKVSVGPWSSAEIRAQEIARTEVKYAQRTSSLSAYRNSGRVNRILLFDARLGSSDADCIARDGTEVIFQEAEKLSDRGGRSAVGI